MVSYDRWMRPIVSQVDRLQRLAVFDAAARAGSFTAAAADLSTSQPAVTRQIRELERALGITLFHRTANRSTLTAAGQALADSIDTGFSGIERRLAELHDPDPMFVLAAPPGFAQQLIVPVLDGLHDALPDVDIRLWLYDRDDELDTGTYDAAIRVGTGSWPGVDDVELFPERVIPVATQALADELGLHATSAPNDVLAAPLLHMEADGRPWMSWALWLETFGLTLTPGRRRAIHNSYPIVIQRALAGRGIALGWRYVVTQLLDDGLLVPVGPEVASDRSYHLTWPLSRQGDERLRLATDWILETTGARTAEP
jgi:LysR family glycine cleavage system transcriptional activator